jgi:hypothetical protein
MVVGSFGNPDYDSFGVVLTLMMMTYHQLHPDPRDF